MAISAVNAWGTGATSALTLSVSPSSIGDILVVYGGQQVASSSAPEWSSVSGGGVTTWNLIGANTLTVSSLDSWATNLWWGIVTATGAATITATGGTSGDTGLGATQFTGGQGTWGTDGSAATGQSTSSSGGNYPSQTPTGAGELYVATGNLSPTAGGSTAGFTYNNDVATARDGVITFVFNPSASSPTAQAPAFSQSTGPYVAVAGLLTFTPAPSYVPRIPIITQAVQRAATR